MTSATHTITSKTYIQVPETSVNPYYSNVTSLREHNHFINPSDFSEDSMKYFLEKATEQIKKDGFYKIRYERVRADGDGRYFTARRWWGNRYGTSSDLKTQIIHGINTKYDLEVFEADSTSSNTASIFSSGGRINKVYTPIPSDAITEVDGLNCYFKLNDNYPSGNKSIYVTYLVIGKPLDEVSYELEQACNEWATVLALRRLKDKRLYNGVVTFTVGRQTINRDEAEFDKLVQMHEDRYWKWITWLKAFIGHRVSIGYMETQPPRGSQFYNRY